MPSDAENGENPWDTSNPAPEIPSPVRLSNLRWRRMIGVVAGFFFGQGTLLGVNVLVGLFLVRSLSIEHYAQFGLAFGFQATATLLMDLGYAGTIIPLVGNRVNDRGLVGSYLRAAKYLRDRAFWILGPLAAITFLAIMQKHHWSWITQAVLVLSVLLTLFSSGPVSYYAAPLFLYHRLREFYIPQTISGLVRLFIYLGLSIIGGLNGCTAAGLSSINVLFNATCLRIYGRRYVEWPRSNEPEVNREVLKYILPAIPTYIFAAFQSQIALFLINAFGQTVNLAEVAALSRLAQLFVVLTSFNLIVIEPRIARLSPEKLLRTYLLMLLVPCGLFLAFVPLAFAFPGIFLWLIGPKYSHLAPTVGWVVLAACLNYSANMVWIMNRSRKWIFWRGTILEIVATFTVDVCFVAFVGVRTTQQAILFTLASSVTSLCTHSYIGMYGFLKGDRNTGESQDEILGVIASGE